MSSIPGHQEYAEKHNIYQLFSNMLEDMVVDKPEDHFQWMIDFLSHDVRRIIITGAPASGKGTQCERIVDKYGVVHISTGDLLRAAVKAGTQLGREADGYMRSGQLVPDQLVIDLVKEKLNSEECRKSGWLLDGFPRTQTQALSMQAAGILPTHVILLNVPDEELMDRALGRRLDPETGKIYHLKTNPPPPDVAARCIQRSDDQEEKVRNRLVQYHSNLLPLKEAYKSLMVSVDGNRAPGLVFNEVNKILSTRQPNPIQPRRVPRVVLFGCANAGVNTLAILLSKRFGSILIDAPLPPAGESYDAEEKRTLETIQRLSQPDCATNGYVLMNFPRTLTQIKLLQNNPQTRPSHSLYLHVNEQELVKRQTRRFFTTDGRQCRKDDSGKYWLIGLGDPVQYTGAVTQKPGDADEDAVQARVKDSITKTEQLHKLYDMTFAPVGECPLLTVQGDGTITNAFERLCEAINEKRHPSTFLNVPP